MTSDGRILVTGASGFLGGAVCRLLKSRGLRPVANGRDVAKLQLLQADGIEIAVADLATIEPAGFARMIGPVQAIVHSAALSSPWGRRQAFEVANVSATEMLLQVASILNVSRFVLVSSPTVYFRFADQINLDETSPLPKPVNDYAATKQRAEVLVTSSTIRQRIVLRPRGIYGKGDVSLLPRLMRAASNGPLPLLRDGVAQTDITHVDDVAEAICAALYAQLPNGNHAFNISGGEPIRLVHIIEEACRINGITPRWRALPAGLVINAARLLEAVHSILPGHPEPKITAYSAGILAFSQTLDISRAAEHLGWRPQTSFEHGLRKTFGAMT